jgi:hypothetical protein
MVLFAYGARPRERWFRADQVANVNNPVDIVGPTQYAIAD